MQPPRPGEPPTHLDGDVVGGSGAPPTHVDGDAVGGSGEPPTHVDGDDTDPAEPNVGWSSESSLPTELAARFPRWEFMGAGSQALVYRVFDDEGRRFVLRVQRAAGFNIDPVLEAFDHPSLARVYEQGRTTQGVGFQILEYVSGATLSQRLSAGERLSDEEIRLLVEQLSGAIDHMTSHERRHGDVSSANVICNSTLSGGRRFTLIDFGLTAVARHTFAPDPARLAATIRYAAPENFFGRPGRRSDYWSLGMLLAELLMGHHPIIGPDETDLAALSWAICYRLFDLSPINDPRWALLVTGLLTTAPEDRWDHVQVGQWLDGESPEVRETAPASGLAAPATRPFRFAGLRFDHDPRRLADAFGSNWEDAARALGTPAVREELTTWARQFGDADLLMAIANRPGPDASLDHDLIDIIGALYRVPVGDHQGVSRSWYHGITVTKPMLRSLAAQGLLAAEDLAGSSIDPDELEAEGANPDLVLLVRLLGGDLDALARAAGRGSPLPRLSRELAEGRRLIASGTERIDPAREPWEELLWGIHLLAALTGSGAAVALRHEAEDATRRRRDLHRWATPAASPAHHLLVTVLAARTPRPRRLGRMPRRRTVRPPANETGHAGAEGEMPEHEHLRNDPTEQPAEPAA